MIYGNSDFKNMRHIPPRLVLIPRVAPRQARADPDRLGGVLGHRVDLHQRRG